jgi:hypothetical protein
MQGNTDLPSRYCPHTTASTARSAAGIAAYTCTYPCTMVLEYWYERQLVSAAAHDTSGQL